MSRNASAICVFLIFLLSLSTVSAQEQFTANSQASYTLCPCSGQGFYITITNSGTTSSTYTLTATGNSKEWVTFSPSSFSLGAKQSGNAAVYVNSPCNQRQAAPVSVAITTKEGLSKTISTTIQFSPSCYGFSLTQGTMVDSANTPSITFTQHEGSYSLCALDTKAIPVLVKNLDTAMENTYAFSVDGPAKLAVSEFGLKHGAAAVLMVEVSPQTAGNSEITLKATSGKGQLTAEKKLSLHADDCYSLAADIAEEKVIMCGGDTKKVDVRVLNSGSFRENISLSIKGAQWASSDVESVSLGANRFSSRAVYLAPPANTKGEFTLLYTAELSGQSTSAQESVLVDVEPSTSCYSSEISGKGKMILGEDYIPLVIKNAGREQQTLSLWIENIDWGELSEESVTLNAGDERHLTLKLSPNESATKGKYTVAIGMASPNQNLKKEITINYAPDTPFARSIKGFFFTYRYILYALTALLIALFLLRNPLIKAYRKNRRMAEVRSAREEAAKKTRLEKEAKLAKQLKKGRRDEEESQPWAPHQWVSMAVIAVALILGICFAVFPAAMKAFFVSYGAAIAIIIISTLAILFVLRKYIKKILRKNKR
jgi:hypothetical protein